MRRRSEEGGDEGRRDGVGCLIPPPLPPPLGPVLCRGPGAAAPSQGAPGKVSASNLRRGVRTAACE